MSDSPLVLMYHGVFDPQTQDRIDKEDRPYALDVKAFEQQLVALKHDCNVISPHALGSVSASTRPSVLITFDDGHLSNFDLAAPLLMQHGLPALFFVTTDFIANRAHFCDWHHLRELQQAGFSVGGHGVSHRFLPTLSSHERRQELAVSKATLEQHLGASCDHMSFPGGRYGAEDLRHAAELGYRSVHTSDEGEACQRHHDGLWQVPRVAMRDGQELAWFERLIQAEPSVLHTLRRRRRLKATAQKLIGHRVYHALYAAKQG